jgi:hypothetical protein
MGSRTAANSIFTKSDAPGPGAYNTSKSTEGPKYTMYSKLDRTSYIGVELEKYRGKPAPGTYSLNHD